MFVMSMGIGFLVHGMIWAQVCQAGRHVPFETDGAKYFR
jgi:hypothetical protein